MIKRVILISITIIVVFNLACPRLATLETAKVSSKPAHEDVGPPPPEVVAAEWLADRRINMYIGKPFSFTGAFIGFEGQIKKVLIDERMDIAVTAGSSGIGFAPKFVLLKWPVFLALKAGIHGFFEDKLERPIGGWFAETIISKDLSKKTEIYTGVKYVGLGRYYAAAGVDEYYLAIPYIELKFATLGGFVGFRFKGLKFDIGLHKVVNTRDDTLNMEGFIPSFGISFPSPDEW